MIVTATGGAATASIFGRGLLGLRLCFPPAADGKEKPMSDKEIEIWGRPLEKMTTTDLREIAKGLEGVSGVHGMKKQDLIAALRKSKGIEVTKVQTVRASVHTLKQQIRKMKVKRAAAIEAQDRKLATIIRRRISRLKKKTRRAAA
jgi:protein-arginine kinase activator protein McsA